jgi:HemK-related putative methylase
MEVIHNFNGLRYQELVGVYPVMEDTLLLVKAVNEYLIEGKGMIMDMGCGVGLISLLSYKNGWKAISVDREPNALRNTRKNHMLNDFKPQLFLSDLFEGIPRSFLGSFDLITFNPPYLSASVFQFDRRSDLALVGGEQGSEVVKRFLMGSSKFLKDQGGILLLGYEEWSEMIIRFASDLKLRVSCNIDKDIDGERFVIFTLFKQL